MKALDVILAILAILIVAFVAAMIWTFWRYQSVPDVLITCVLGTGTAELVAAAAITIVKKKYAVTKKKGTRKNADK